MSDTSFAVASGSSLAVSGDISGNGSLTESGGGVLTLSGANSDAGGTTVLSGKLIVMYADSLADGSSLTVGNPSYFAVVTPSSSTAAAPASTQPATPAALPATPPAAPKHAAAAHVLSDVARAPAVSAARVRGSVACSGVRRECGNWSQRGGVRRHCRSARDAIFFEYGQLVSPSALRLMSLSPSEITG